ncbi:uncharacterized protein LOC8262535 [Ricinus communis]|uniref:Transmembrane protein n=1 Tax=Ricinus communis TaxID=3988 RepID=B9SP86_RICCO|nr:uncharacterized protein LOC8262535 [Ricinus communis]EEF34577.1 conserved hypothetical protein [Ricinus communis]|eukprot:XP_002527805.1 uncharacterized protein LOC8262535 [Ricinus communis]
MAEQTDTRNSPEDNSKHHVLACSSLPPYPFGDLQMYPIVYPAMVPGFTPSLQNQDQMHRGAGIYAVPVPPVMGPIAGFPSNTLIPLTYNVPTTRSSSNAGAPSDHGQGGQQPQQHQQQQQQPAAQRQVVVRRFQIAFQLDLLLILKLAAVIFLFNQDGSRQRLVVLVFFASLVYLYQTGALTPLVQWLSQSMQRAAQPPRPPRPVVRPENAPPVARQNEIVALAEGQAVADNESHPPEDGNQAVENENIVEPGEGDGGNNWWGIVKEIQMVVFGFITSLLPGFHNVD